MVRLPFVITAFLSFNFDEQILKALEGGVGWKIGNALVDSGAAKTLSFPCEILLDTTCNKVFSASVFYFSPYNYLPPKLCTRGVSRVSREHCTTETFALGV